MGAGQSTHQWVDQIPVPASLKSYPSPQPPAFLLPDLLKNYKIRDTPTSEDKEGNIDWKQIKDIATRSIDEQAAIETGKLTPTGSLVNTSTNQQSGLNNGPVNKEGNGKATGEEHGPIKDSTNSGYNTENNNQKQSIIEGQQQKPSKKISFEEIDQHAREAQPHHGETFKGLLSYISKKVPDTQYREVFLVRGITAWFCNRNIEGLKPVTGSLASPDGLVQHIRNKSLSFTSAYALLIRAVNIPCVIVHGLEKGGHYKPGDTVDELTEGHWCAVYVDKSWQLIHPLWACRGTYTAGREKENLVLIEEDAQKESEINDVLAGLQQPKEPPIKHILHDDYFMPKPDVLRYKCHPYERKWSLLTREVTLKPNEELTENTTLNAKEQFKIQACLSVAFFKLSLQLLSSPYNSISTDDGDVSIEFGLIPELTRKLFFRFKLSVKNVENKNDERLLTENISRLVLYHRCSNRAVFEISLPCKGTYLFEISAGIKGTFYNICKFQLTSTADHDLPLLPLDVGKDGWGPGPLTQTAGLLVPSQPKGIISYQSLIDEKTKSIQPRRISIRFDVSREYVENTEYSVEIIRSPVNPTGQSRETTQTPVNEKAMNKWVSCIKDRLTRTLEIEIKIPQEGQYALIIRTTQLEDRPLNMKAVKQGTTRDVCYYLLAPSAGNHRQGPKVKFAKSELDRAVVSENYQDMLTAVERCLLLGLGETHEAIATVKVRMEYIKLKNDITDCIKRRNLSVLNDTLLRVLKYRYRAALVDEVEELLDFRKKILAIDGYQMYLPSIREASDELYKMPHIPAEVHVTMQALLLVLRHPAEKLDWPYVKSQLRVTGDRPGNLVKQLEMYDSVSSPPDFEYVRLAEQVLYRYTFPQVLRVNHSAATFYKWVEAVVLRLREFERMQREYETRQAEKEIQKTEIRRVKQEKKAKKKYKRQHRSF